MNLLWTLLLPLVGSALALMLRRSSSTVIAWTAALPVCAAALLLAWIGPTVLGGDVLREQWRWVPAAGLSAGLRADGLSWLFAMVVVIIGLLIQLYARYYMETSRELGRLYALLGLFMTSMLGLVFSDNLVMMVVFWEATSLVSYLLIGFNREDPDARAGAQLALSITATGGLCLLGGVLLLGRMVGSYDLETVLAAGDLIRAHELYLPALVLVLLGAFTKSAQFPFHFWLPRAMAAPTPISAYLHSATMVKAGVFLLARMYPALAGTEAWLGIVSTVGLLTLLFGAYSAMWQHDLKGLLAYSTISHLGLITLLLGFNSPMAVGAAIFHIVNHATFKASLFMAAGMIDHEVGTRDMRVLNGLWKHMPFTGALAIVAAGAMAGVPLLNGFISKEMFFAEALAAREDGIQWFVPFGAVLAGALAVGYSLRFVMEVFFNDEGREHPQHPHEPPTFMRLPATALALGCLAVGVAPAVFVFTPLTRAVTATLQAPAPVIDLALWHGVNLPLLMSIVALAGGVVLYRLRDRAYRWHDRLPPIEAADLFDVLVRFTRHSGGRVNTALENGSLQRYSLLLITSAVVMGVTPWLRTALPGTSNTLTTLALSLPDAPSTVIAVMLVIGVFATVRQRHRPLTAIIAISVVGLFMSLAFVRLAAPDLALTQLLVELVTILLLLLALPYFATTAHDSPGLRLSILRPLTPSSAWRLWRDGAVAIAAALATGAGTFLMLEQPFTSRSAYYLENSLSKGGGRNVVNVILVDFRGFDTMGEVAVLGAAALGVLVVLHGMRFRLDAGDVQFSRFAERHPLLLAMIARAMLPLALLMSMFVLLRGHDLPGGGFAAGLLTAIALAVQTMASGAEWTRQRLRTDFVRWIVIGFTIVLSTGLGSLAVGRPFLTSSYQAVQLPVIGKIPLGSALLFDIGVYVVVVGTVLVILNRLAQLSQDLNRVGARS